MTGGPVPDRLAALAEQVARLEQDVVLAAGGTPLPRPLLPHEAASGVDFVMAEAALDAAEDDLTTLLTQARTEALDAVDEHLSDAEEPRELVEEVNGLWAGTVVLAGMGTSTRSLRGRLHDRLVDFGDREVDVAAGELAEHGVEVSSAPSGWRDVAAVQAAALAALPYGDAVAAVRSALTYVPWFAERVGDAVREVVQTARNASAPALRRDAGAAAAVVTGAARAAVHRQAGDRVAYYASELLDRNTCGPCRAVDGTPYQSLDDAATDYPMGRYVACQGGTRCRGMIVTVSRS